jgi:hypothetical protein
MAPVVSVIAVVSVEAAVVSVAAVPPLSLPHAAALRDKTASKALSFTKRPLRAPEVVMVGEPLLVMM